MKPSCLHYVPGSLRSTYTGFWNTRKSWTLCCLYDSVNKNPFTIQTKCFVLKFFESNNRHLCTSKLILQHGKVSTRSKRCRLCSIHCLYNIQPSNKEQNNWWNKSKQSLFDKASVVESVSLFSRQCQMTSTQAISLSFDLLTLPCVIYIWGTLIKYFIYKIL